MNEKKYSYLSDEKLLSLIEDTENNAMFAAPPDLISDVISKIEAADQKEKEPPGTDMVKNSVIEYRRFCMRVSIAVAAAIALIITAPLLMPGIRSGYSDMLSGRHMSETEQVLTKEEVLKDISIPSKEEVVSNNIPSREDVLNKKGITDRVRDSHFISNLYDKRDS